MVPAHQPRIALPAPLHAVFDDALRSYGALWVLEQMHHGASQGLLLIYGDDISQDDELGEFEDRYARNTLAIASWQDA